MFEEAELEKDWVTPSAKKLHGEKRMGCSREKEYLKHVWKGRVFAAKLEDGCGILVWRL
jgi:hypothetical protein